MSKLIWEQDFVNGGGDLSLWNIRIGNDLLDDNDNPIYAGWGNGEQQFYTDHPNNLYFDEYGLNLRACLEKAQQEGRSLRIRRPVWIQGITSLSATVSLSYAPSCR